MEWGFFVFLWFSMGIVGSVLGAIVEKVVAGFFLGFFLGPIGWIIVFLLPRDQESKKVPIAQKTEPEKRADRPERNLESNAYKIWLGKTYNIQKNELFEKYEFDGNLFETLDEALADAHQKEREKDEKLGDIERNRQERQEIKERQKVEIDYEKVERRRIEKEKQKPGGSVAMFVGIAGVFLLLIMTVSLATSG